MAMNLIEEDQTIALKEIECDYADDSKYFAFVIFRRT